MNILYLNAIGLAGPGLPNWATTRSVLAQGRNPDLPDDVAYVPQLLPPNERRRATPAVRQAFRAAEDAISATEQPAPLFATVFASSDADLSVSHRINTALATPQRAVSPTDFHNSVHNAAAGYWSIATGCREPSTAVGGYDGSFAVGLLEAATQVASDGLNVLMVAYDVIAPAPLLDKRRLSCAASIALVLSPKPEPYSLCQVRVSLARNVETRLPDSALENLRLSNPALRGLPLLCLLARGEVGHVALPYLMDRSLRVEIAPV